MKKLFASSLIALFLILYGLPFIFTSDLVANVKSEMKEYTGEYIKEKRKILLKMSFLPKRMRILTQRDGEQAPKILFRETVERMTPIYG